MKTQVSVAQRLASKLVRMPNSCLEWTGCLGHSHYGQMTIGSLTDGSRRTIATHRFAWESANGPIPDGLFVLHHCDNRKCCDVNHLFLGTKADNTADMIAKGRKSRDNGQAYKTHCVNGHPFDEANTYRHNGKRSCRRCSTLNARTYRTEKAVCAVCGAIVSQPSLRRHFRNVHYADTMPVSS